jgi:hypothetical protein
MNAPKLQPPTLELSGIDGANPLGFLAALGTLACCHAAGGVRTQLAWVRKPTWTPVLHDPPDADPATLVETLLPHLAGRIIPADAEERRKQLQKSMEAAQTAIKKKQGEIKGRGLSRAEREEAERAELVPLYQQAQQKRRQWLLALKDAVPRDELVLGKGLDCEPDMFRSIALEFRAQAAHSARETLDFLAAFGSDGCCEKKSQDRIEATPFYFIRGSGQQYFLDTARQLISNCNAEHLRDTLFAPWKYADEGLSMRWDPIEDRQYALLAEDPGKVRTQWMANLLAYRGLVFFPTAPTQRGLVATAWSGSGDELVFTWPLWTHPLPPDTIRSVLLLRELAEPAPDHDALRARGIVAAYRSRRIKVGSGANFKLNFSPSRAV